MRTNITKYENGTRHTLTGVWVEICRYSSTIWNHSVTPSRVCELKYLEQFVKPPSYSSHPHGCVSWNFSQIQLYRLFWSHPHGCVSWNPENTKIKKYFESHTLTGVWVEIFICGWIANIFVVTPSRVCELKLHHNKSHLQNYWSHPHGCVSWN